MTGTEQVVSDGLLEAGYSVKQVALMLAVAKADIIYLIIDDQERPVEVHFSAEKCTSRMRTLQRKLDNNRAAYANALLSLEEQFSAGELTYDEWCDRRDGALRKLTLLFDHTALRPDEPTVLSFTTVKIG